MDFPFLSLVAFFGVYTVLFFTRRSLIQHPSHSFILRLVVGIVAWCLTAAAAIYGASIIVLATAFFTGDAGAGYEIVFQLIILIVVIRLYVYYEDSMELGEMKNFLRDALTFGNYVRKKDYELREELDRHETRRIYKEVTGIEPASDVTATAYDYHPPPLSKERGPERKVSHQLHKENVRRLAAGDTVDVTEVFHLELMGNNAHPFIPLMNNMLINGEASTLTFAIILPVGQQLRWNEPNAKQRTIERMYEFLVIVTSLPWFSRYDRYTRTVTATLIQTDLNDDAKEERTEIVRFEIPLAKLRARGTKITPASEVEKIAKITFYH